MKITVCEKRHNAVLTSTPARSVLRKYNDHRWDVGHRHSGRSAVSSPRSKRGKHAEMGESELELFVTYSKSIITYIHHAVGG